MLTHLTIENFAIIDRVDVELSPGLVALTGETGAGKSIIVDAVGGLLGNRLSVDVVRSGAAQARIEGMVSDRPDWCISRQRTWGVPIPAFYTASGEAILDARIVRNTARLFEKHGSNFWFDTAQH